MLNITFSTTVAGFPLDGAQIVADLAFREVADGTELVSLSYGGDILTRFSFDEGTLEYNMHELLSHGSAPIGLGAELVQFNLGNTNYLSFAGFNAADTPLYQVMPNGDLADATSMLGDLALQAKTSGLAVADIGGSDVLFSIDHIGGTLKA